MNKGVVSNETVVLRRWEVKDKNLVPSTEFIEGKLDTVKRFKKLTFRLSADETKFSCLLDI